MAVHQKLGIILENKGVQKLTLEKNVSIKKWSPKLIFTNGKLQNLETHFCELLRPHAPPFQKIK